MKRQEKKRIRAFIKDYWDNPRLIPYHIYKLWKKKGKRMRNGHPILPEEH